jgi:hypothetical protein
MMFAVAFSIGFMLPPIVGVLSLVIYRKNGFLKRTLLSLFYVLLSTCAVALAVYALFILPLEAGPPPTPGVGVVFVPVIMGLILGFGVTLIGSLVTSLTITLMSAFQPKQTLGEPSE